MKALLRVVSLAGLAAVAACTGDGYGYGDGPYYGYAQRPAWGYSPGYYGARPYHASSRPYYPNYGSSYGPSYGPRYGYAPGYATGGPGFTLIANFPQGTVP